MGWTKSLAGASAWTWIATAAMAQTFDNAAVIALHRAGLGEATLVSKVNSVPCGYDVSTDGLIALKRADVPDAVIAAMVKRCDGSARAQGISANAADPRGIHAPGIYVGHGDGSAPMQMMRPSKASSIKVTGNGSILLPYVGRLILPESESHLAIDGPRPAFFFYFPARDRNVSDFGTPNSLAAQSPDEFSLVRFKVKGDAREIGVGKLSVYSARRGIDAKETVRFSSSEVGDFAYRVEPDRDLAPGEYAFVLTGANNAARVYDFTIR